MRVHVTGASGFVGRAFLPVLASSGHELSPTIEGAQAVVHLAAIAHRRASREELEAVNVTLTARVGRAAAAEGARLVFASSLKVHGDEAREPLRETSALAPGDAYARSKARAEDALRAIAGLQLTVLRPPLVYGPSVRANFLALMRAVARGWPLPFASIANRRSLVYAGNLADAIIRCLEAPRAAGRMYVVGESTVSTPQLCRAIGDALGRPARLFPFPPALLPIKSLTRSLEVDDSAIRRELGWRPRLSLEQGLRDTAAWYSRR